MEVGIEPPISGSGVRGSTTRPPRSPLNSRYIPHCSIGIIIVGGANDRTIVRESTALLTGTIQIHPLVFARIVQFIQFV